MTLEQIAWRGVHVELPKDKRTVLVYGPTLLFNNGAVTHTWFGWYDAGVWFAIDAAELAGVTHWAELPKGAD